MRRREKWRPGDGRRRQRLRGGRKMRKLTVILVMGVAFAGFGTANASAAPRVMNTLSCHEVTWTYSGFPEGVEVRGVERVKVDKTVIAKKEYKFTGPNGFDSVKINVEAGTHVVSGHVEFYYGGTHKEADHGA